jgi:hypothetical protein
MTEQVAAWFRNQWASQVIVKFQNKGFMLKGTVEPPIKIEGDKFYFLRTGLIDAQLFTKGDSITPINSDDDKIEMASKEWDAPVEIYDWDVTRLGVREVDARQAQCSYALGRKADRIIYDAIMGAALPGSQIFGDYTKPFDPYVFKNGLAKLSQNDVEGDGGVFAPLPVIAYGQMEMYKEFSNAEWAGPDLPLRSMTMTKARSWDIANCFQAPPHLTNAYTTGTDLRFRVWHKSAVGAGSNDNVRNEWGRDFKKKCWVANHTIDGAAVAIQPAGIIEFRMKADSAIAQQVLLTKVAP